MTKRKQRNGKCVIALFALYLWSLMGADREKKEKNMYDKIIACIKEAGSIIKQASLEESQIYAKELPVYFKG